MYSCIKGCGTVETSGHFLPSKATVSQVSLLPHIKLIGKKDLSSPCEQLGEGRFAKCYLSKFSHFMVCTKVFKKMNNSAFIHEFNILSKFTHPNLPYLFGVNTDEPQSIITSFHGLNNKSITFQCAFSSEVSNEANFDWVDLLKEIACGLEYLHNKHKIIHNDIKGDNIVLSSTLVSTCTVKAVIIDFGKACDITKGKRYKLSEDEKQQYKSVHTHIAPDLRDGICTQSASSDIYSFGKLVNALIKSHVLHNTELEDLSQKCMQYHSISCPNLHSILKFFS